MGRVTYCIILGSLLVLVNASLTEEVAIFRGLNNGDMLAAFLYLLVAEGLGFLMSKAVEKVYFKGFRILES